MLGKKLATYAFLILTSVYAFGSGPLYPAEQKNAPARLISTTHAIDDWLQSAQLQNNSGKKIVAYRIGWAYTHGQKQEFHRGPWMNVPAGIAPETKATVSAQAVPPDDKSDSTAFFVDELKFSDGQHWRSNHKTVLKVASK